MSEPSMRRTAKAYVVGAIGGGLALTLSDVVLGRDLSDPPGFVSIAIGCVVACWLYDAVVATPEGGEG